jgi:hypothetical protein
MTLSSLAEAAATNNANNDTNAIIVNVVTKFKVLQPDPRSTQNNTIICLLLLSIIL